MSLQTNPKLDLVVIRKPPDLSQFLQPHQAPLETANSANLARNADHPTERCVP
ncbi:hypothetical protein LINPERPRIM_LOCUS18828 [Linum perenne]